MGEEHTPCQTDRQQWRIIPLPQFGADADARIGRARQQARFEHAARCGGLGRVVAGGIELRPMGAAPPPSANPRAARQVCYRLKLVREPTGWRLVTERAALDWPPGRRPRTSSLRVPHLGEARAEVERLWGSAVWAALLRASSRTLQVLAPSLIPDRPEHLSALG